jgi:protein-disulfide isomerase
MTPRLPRQLAVAAAVAGLAAATAVAAAPSPGDMSLGNRKAKIEVVEYASLSCPHCAHFNAEIFPAFKAKYIDTGRVHFTLREFLTPPGNVAAAGFLMARCAGPSKYFAVVDGVFRSQAEWPDGHIKESLLKVAKANGLTEAQFEACLKDEAALKALEERVRRAVEVDKVDSTPTIEVNGKRLEGVPQSLADLDAAIAAAKPGGR